MFCFGVTRAYGVPKDFLYPTKPLQLFLHGIHTGTGAEALVGELSDPANPNAIWSERPDGKTVHITLSTAHGIPPARAGEIDDTLIQPIKPSFWTVQLLLLPRRIMQPELQAA